MNLLRAMLRFHCPWCASYPSNYFGQRVLAALYELLVPRWFVLKGPSIFSRWGRQWHWFWHVTSREWVLANWPHEAECDICIKRPVEEWGK